MSISKKNERIIQIILGSMMMFHAGYTVSFYSVFLGDLHTYLLGMNIENFKPVGIPLSLFPFIEFFLGTLFFLGLYTQKALWSAIVIFAFIMVFLVLANAYTALIVSAIILATLILLLVFKRKMSEPKFPKDSFQL